MSESSNFNETNPQHISNFLGDAARELHRSQKKAEFAERQDVSKGDVVDSVWSEYDDGQLSEMLVSNEVPGRIKDEIAEFVVSREILPPEGD